MCNEQGVISNISGTIRQQRMVPEILEISEKNRIVSSADGAVLGSLSEDGEDAAEGGDEGVDLFAGVVDCERCPDGAGHSEAFHERLGAMMSRAHRHSHAVKKHTEIVIVDIADIERYDGRFSWSVAVDRQSRYLVQSLGGIS